MQTTLAAFNATLSDDAFALQNPHLLRVRLDGGDVLVRAGAAVALRGDVTDRGEADGPPPGLVRLEGRGEVFLAHRADDVHLVLLEGDAIVAAAERLLAFDTALERRPLVAGGLAAVALSGGGWVALLTEGTPVVLDVTHGRTVVGVRSVVAWADTVEPAASGADSLALGGGGWVLVQAA